MHKSFSYLFGMFEDIVKTLKYNNFNFTMSEFLAKLFKLLPLSRGSVITNADIPEANNSGSMKKCIL